MVKKKKPNGVSPTARDVAAAAVAARPPAPAGVAAAARRAETAAATKAAAGPQPLPKGARRALAAAIFVAVLVLCTKWRNAQEVRRPGLHAVMLARRVGAGGA
jgi:hypothetical protein